jgi:hypothetical protein
MHFLCAGLHTLVWPSHSVVSEVTIRIRVAYREDCTGEIIPVSFPEIQEPRKWVLLQERGKK